jgi:hypothetical protein
MFIAQNHRKRIIELYILILLKGFACKVKWHLTVRLNPTEYAAPPLLISNNVGEAKRASTGL